VSGSAPRSDRGRRTKPASLPPPFRARFPTPTFLAPDASLAPGRLRAMAKSGTLSYEVNHRLVQRGLGQSRWIGVGGDPVKGTRFEGNRQDLWYSSDDQRPRK